MRDVLLVQPDATGDAGYVGERLADRGLALHEIAVCPSPDDPIAQTAVPDLAAFDGVVVFGAVWSVYDRATIGAWLDPLLDGLRAAHAARVPVFGICFGGQALATALGARVGPASRGEIGWHEVASDVPGHLASAPWFQWHGDRFDVPEGAQEIARNEVCPQAFVLDRSLGVQFHPEVTPEIAAFWAEHGHGELRLHGIDHAELLARTDALAPTARRHAHRLVDWWLDDLARR